jgi:hypothetical protein
VRDWLGIRMYINQTPSTSTISWGMMTDDIEFGFTLNLEITTFNGTGRVLHCNSGRVMSLFRLGVNIVVRLAQAMPHLVEIRSIVEYHYALLSPHCLVNSLVCLKPFAYASIHLARQSA